MVLEALVDVEAQLGACEVGRVHPVRTEPEDLVSDAAEQLRHGRRQPVDRVRDHPGHVALRAQVERLAVIDVIGLAVVASSIEDRRDNSTRFLVIGGDPPPPSGRDLTSIVFTTRRDEAGALFRLLEPFAREAVNLTSIQLRPIKGKPWEYLFFIDCEGHRSEAAVHRAIESAARSPFFDASRRSPMIFCALIRDGVTFAMGRDATGERRRRPPARVSAGRRRAFR